MEYILDILNLAPKRGLMKQRKRRHVIEVQVNPICQASVCSPSHVRECCDRDVATATHRT